MPRGTAKPLAVRANMPAPPALNFSMSLRVSRILSSRSMFFPSIYTGRCNRRFGENGANVRLRGADVGTGPGRRSDVRGRSGTRRRELSPRANRVASAEPPDRRARRRETMSPSSPLRGNPGDRPQRTGKPGDRRRLQDCSATVGGVAAVALPSPPVARARTRRAARAREGALVAALLAGSVALRAHALGHRLWMDEGIAVGIASHPLAQIPGALRPDGSPHA